MHRPLVFKIGDANITGKINKAVQAGNDMLCTGYGMTALNAIYKAVKDGKVVCPCEECVRNAVLIYGEVMGLE